LIVEVAPPLIVKFEIVVVASVLVPVITKLFVPVAFVNVKAEIDDEAKLVFPVITKLFSVMFLIPIGW